MLFGNQSYLYYLGSPNTININKIINGYAEINKDTPHDYPEETDLGKNKD